MRKVEAAIFNNSTPPLELLEHQYRKLFGLSYTQMQTEPVDQVVIGLGIEALLKEKEARETNG